MTALDIITDRIRTLSALLDELEALRRLVAQADAGAQQLALGLAERVAAQAELLAKRAEAKPVEVAPAAGKPEPAARDRVPAPGGAKRQTGELRERRLMVAAHLSAEGPLRVAELEELADLPRSQLKQCLAHEWFEKSGPKLFDPYRLTDLGAAALEAARAPSPPTPNPT